MARIDNFMPSPVAIAGQPSSQGGSANGGTLLVTATTTSAPYLLPEGGEDLEIYNAGSVTVYIEQGQAGVVATVPSGTFGSYPIPAGITKVIRRLNYFLGGATQLAPWIAVIASSTTAVITISVGTGS